MPTPLPTVLDLQRKLDAGETTSVQLVEEALARINDPAGEGSRAFTAVWADQARAAARASDTLRQAGLARSPLEGLPVSIKDLFDVAGKVTKAGAALRRNAAPAERHAATVARLAQAGAVLIGHTNMTEFAFSGLGLNPHFGTPSSPWDRANRRIPGGSSSGAGVSVADGMAVAALGTDTGGSIRIPSAFCGLTGFKPTAARVPAKGAFPLASSLDSSGPLAASVNCCAIIDAILSGEDRPLPEVIPAPGLRLATTHSLVRDGMDAHVNATFIRTLGRLRDAGVVIDEIEIPEFLELAHINRKGGLVCAEAYAVHRDELAAREAEYDPRVASRILRGRNIDCADYIELHAERSRWQMAVEARLHGYDALLLPTVPIVAPTIAELEASDDAYFAANALILRNPTLINFLDGCALSLPCHAAGEAPVGLMVAGPAFSDERVLQTGRSIEAILAA
ncbi:MAG TPA: amidase [Burkholderiaceae bacterium]|nr:amidase [bacterium SGD-2]HZH56644.1 amidase [Burkholderiaceae bacterium]